MSPPMRPLLAAVALAAFALAAEAGEEGAPSGPQGPAELAVERTIPGAIEGGVSALAASRDGRLLAAGGFDGSVSIADLLPPAGDPSATVGGGAGGWRLVI